jgi:hypothetical protein
VNRYLADNRQAIGLASFKAFEQEKLEELWKNLKEKFFYIMLESRAKPKH